VVAENPNTGMRIVKISCSHSDFPARVAFTRYRIKRYPWHVRLWRWITRKPVEYEAEEYSPYAYLGALVDPSKAI
jgi:hypothetical protein